MPQRNPPTPEEVAAWESAERRKAGEALVSFLAAKRGPRYHPDRCDLTTFAVYDPKQRDLLARAKALAARVAEAVAAGEGVVFYGPPGTGKDHLLAALLYAAARSGSSVSWVNGQEIFGGFRDRIDTGEQDEGHFRALCAPAVLGISDPIPPAGQPSAWDLGNLYRILDRRYCEMKPTWVSLNALTLDDADAKLSAPVFDRLRHDATLFPCFWQSYRERQKA
jgi:putative replication protein